MRARARPAPSPSGSGRRPQEGRQIVAVQQSDPEADQGGQHGELEAAEEELGGEQTGHGGGKDRPVRQGYGQAGPSPETFPNPPLPLSFLPDGRFRHPHRQRPAAQPAGHHGGPAAPRRSPSSPAPPAPARARSPSTPSTPKGSGATSSRFRPTPSSSSTGCPSRWWTGSRASRPRSPSSSGIPTVSSRSTVGTATEVYDYLRLLWARIGRSFAGCAAPRCAGHAAIGGGRDASGAGTGRVSDHLSAPSGRPAHPRGGGGEPPRAGVRAGPGRRQAAATSRSCRPASTSPEPPSCSWWWTG